MAPRSNADALLSARRRHERTARATRKHLQIARCSASPGGVFVNKMDLAGYAQRAF